MWSDDSGPYSPVRWASITLHPWLPPQVVQVACARAWGARSDWIAGIEAPSTYTDDARGVGRTTNWTGRLPQRAELVRVLAKDPGPRQQVFFASPLAVGFTARHASETIEALFSLRALIYVHSQGALYRQGDDMAEFIDLVERERKAATQRVYRERRKVE